MEILKRLHFVQPLLVLVLVLVKKKVYLPLPLDITFFLLQILKKKIQLSGNLELCLQLPGCPQLIILFLLEALKQDWHYAKVLHLEETLQEASLQSQQGARNLALHPSASARKY